MQTALVHTQSISLPYVDLLNLSSPCGSTNSFNTDIQHHLRLISYAKHYLTWPVFMTLLTPSNTQTTTAVTMTATSCKYDLQPSVTVWLKPQKNKPHLSHFWHLYTLCVCLLLMCKMCFMMCCTVNISSFNIFLFLLIKFNTFDKHKSHTVSFYSCIQVLYNLQLKHFDYQIQLK